MAQIIRLVDLSALIHPIWHTHQDVMEMNPDVVSEVCCREVRSICAGARSAICVDRKPTLRLQIDGSYKANREEKPPAFVEQIRKTVCALRKDGWPIWQAEGCEADDVIASSVKLLVDDDRADGFTIEIITGDKDLMALVDDAHAVSVRVPGRSGEDDQLFNEAAVRGKYGVSPAQIPDWLCLVGDSADNIMGAKGFGPKTAATLLTDRTLDEVMENLSSVSLPVTPMKRSALFELRDRLSVVRNLVELIDDIPISVDELFTKEAPVIEDPKTPADELDEMPAPVLPAPVPVPVIEQVEVEPVPTVLDEEKPLPGAAQLVTQSLGLRQQLDAQNLAEARQLAKWLHDSRLFADYGKPEAVLTTILLGRELGLSTMAALRSVHIVKGKHVLSADVMVALVLSSGLAEYFEMLESTPTSSTWVTKRRGGRKEQSLTYTREQAETAGFTKNSSWQKFPVQMCRKQAKAELARLVYPDLLAGLYTADELA